MYIPTPVWSIGYIFLVALTHHGSAQTHYAHEKSLRNATLTGYEYKIRPDTKVTCAIRLSLLNINLLNVPLQSFSVSGWLVVKWTDSRLTWTPASHGNIEYFFDTELILWRPEIIVENSISNIGVIENDKLLIRVTHLGEMTWEPPLIFETHCEMDVMYYPFDTQTCEIQVTSWAYTKEDVDLRATDSHVYLEDYSENGEWELLTTWSDMREVVDGADIHSQIDFHLKLRRRPAYYIMTIVIPVIVTSILCVLVFLLPADSGEKVGYALTILLTYTVMLTLVAGYMPPTSKTISILSIYITIILFVGVFSTLFTVIGLYFHHHDDETKPPPGVVSFFRSVFIPCISWKKPGGDSGGDQVKEIPSTRVTSPRVHPVFLRERSKVDVRSASAASVTDKVDGENKEPELTWQDLAVIMDKFLFRVFAIFVFVLTFLIIILLLIGGYALN